MPGIWQVTRGASRINDLLRNPHFKISNRQHAADLLRNEVEEKLRLLDWFAQLDAPIKQKLLVKYALLRMYQSRWFSVGRFDYNGA